MYITEMFSLFTIFTIILKNYRRRSIEVGRGTTFLQTLSEYLHWMLTPSIPPSPAELPELNAAWLMLSLLRNLTRSWKLKYLKVGILRICQWNSPAILSYHEAHWWKVLPMCTELPISFHSASFSYT